MGAMPVSGKRPGANVVYLVTFSCPIDSREYYGVNDELQKSSTAAACVHACRLRPTDCQRARNRIRCTDDFFYVRCRLSSTFIQT